MNILKFNIILLISICLGCYHSAGQTTIDTTAIQMRLDYIRDRDQKTRVTGDSIDFISYIDSCNLADVERILNTYGWLGISVIGARANNTLFLVIQHADLTTQEKYLPLMKKSVEEGESRPKDLALLIDRILMRRGEKQKYGSQVVFDDKGNPVFYPIEDEMHVNERRKEMGLDPIEEYAKFFGIEYLSQER